MGYGHLHCLDLLVFGRDGADFVAHLVAFHRHVLALNAGGEGRKTEIQELHMIQQHNSSALPHMQTFTANKQQVKALNCHRQKPHPTLFSFRVRRITAVPPQMEKQRKWFYFPANSSNASQSSWALQGKICTSDTFLVVQLLIFFSSSTDGEVVVLPVWVTELSIRFS